MKDVHSPSVVRLSPAPKRVVHQVVLAKHVTHVERKAETARVSLATSASHRHPTSKKSPLRTPQFAKRQHSVLTASLGMTLATGILGQLATVLLVPMLFLQPLLPLYAADESIAPPESTSPSVTESAPVSTEASPAAEAPVETPPSEVSSETIAPAPSEPVAEAAPSTAEAAAEAPLAEETQPASETTITPAETPAEEAGVGAVADETTATPPEIPGGGVAGGATGAVGEGEPQGGIVAGDATTTPEIEQAPVPEPAVGGGGAPVSDAGITPSGGTAADVSSVTEGTTTAEEVVPSEEAPKEEVVTEEVAPTQEVDPEAAAREAEAVRQAEEARQQSLRDAMRKEVEAEITKGCLTIDNVGYYCLKNFEGSAPSLATTTKVTSVQSLPDPKSGAKEIFITKNGASIQLTHNTWDDTFPAMDVTGKSVVWQGMTDGRWQIFFADVSGTGTPAIVQLTHSGESNFNPRVDGNTVVWQGWVSGNWEIFLADHLLPSSYYPDGEEDVLPSENRRLGINGEWHVARLTENTTHDMFPAISGGLVTWQSFQGGSWNVYAYNMKTGESTQLSQGGVKSENPRFAVTWDEHDANGNTRMVGYDIATGKTIDLTDAARQTPNNPNPYHPELPTPVQNQAALPTATSTGTSTPARPDGDDDGGMN